MPTHTEEIARRRTFAIISHPDAGKTTVTEQLLLYGGAIQLAGTVKARKSSRHATSDWMAMEKERGISITSSVMQFLYKDSVINLLDTPGHADFSEDTYRTLTAVDSALMVIDAAKGVEDRTRTLMQVCRLRDTPVLTFINKLDREGREAIDLLDEIENELQIQCVPITWPLGMGGRLQGIYHLPNDCIHLYAKNDEAQDIETIQGLQSEAARRLPQALLTEVKDEIELLQGAGTEFAADAYLAGQQTPVFFGTALHNFGVVQFLDYLLEYAPSPLPRAAQERAVNSDEDKLSGFVFKVQANMDPAHRDRIAFMRLVSGRYEKGMKLYHSRIDRHVRVADAVTFLAGNRDQAKTAWAGDIIGLHNHGTIRVGDTFTQGEKLNFTGIPHFAPELFRRIRLCDPMKAKALLKGLLQLGEEGATQVFRPLQSNDLILGAIGMLQFDVVIWRLKEEYGVDCSYENIAVNTVRWITCEDSEPLERFKRKCNEYLALDGSEHLSYLAPSIVNLNLTIERWPEIEFLATREH